MKTLAELGVFDPTPVETHGGILKGVVRYNKHPKRIIGVQISGYDKRATIEKILRADKIKYEMAIDYTYPYSKHIQERIAGGTILDPIYEAKAHKWMRQNIDTTGKKVLFWIVGNSMMARQPFEGGAT